MTDFEYDAWTEKHGWLFGLSSPDWQKAFFAWRLIFEAVGYSAAELETASAAMASSVKIPSWPKEHLESIHRHVRESRAIHYRESKSTFEDKHGRCGVCSGTGFVVVPHIKAVAAARWEKLKVARMGASWYTMAVTCCCALGRHKQASYPPDRQPMGLESYEKQNPSWSAQMRQRAMEQQGAFEANGGPECSTFRLLVDRLRGLEPSDNRVGRNETASHDG